VIDILASSVNAFYIVYNIQSNYPKSEYGRERVDILYILEFSVNNILTYAILYIFIEDRAEHVQYNIGKGSAVQWGWGQTKKLDICF
jgi:hypothetical protein